MWRTGLRHVQNCSKFAPRITSLRSLTLGKPYSTENIIRLSHLHRESTRMPEFASITSTVSEHSKAFPVNADDVVVLTSPDQFYRKLMEMSKSAEKRVYLASLYMGHSDMCHDLISTLSNNAKLNPSLRIQIMLDFFRGTRGAQSGSSSVDLLSPFLSAHETQAQLALFHSPSVSSMWRSVLGERHNEIISLQHIKIYLFDDTVILSGANLNRDYFTNRQDRYIVIRNQALADFYAEAVDSIVRWSYKINGGNLPNLRRNASDFYKALDDYAAPEIVPHEKPMEFTKALSHTFLKFWESHVNEQSASTSSPPEGSARTWVYPAFQMPYLGITTDQCMFSSLVESCEANGRLDIASGYLNMPAEYESLIVESPGDATIYSASPQANGFFGASGFAGIIPTLYSWAERALLHRIRNCGVGSRVRVCEYERKGWTFHAKGLWLGPPSKQQETPEGVVDNRQDWPMLTLIGSANFGHRSVHRDLEVSAAIVTEDADLRQRLKVERDNVALHCKQMSLADFETPDRTIPLYMNILGPLIRRFF
eukprot:194567_1